MKSSTSEQREAQRGISAAYAALYEAALKARAEKAKAAATAVASDSQAQGGGAVNGR